MSPARSAKSRANAAPAIRMPRTSKEASSARLRIGSAKPRSKLSRQSASWRRISSLMRGPPGSRRGTGAAGRRARNRRRSGAAAWRSRRRAVPARGAARAAPRRSRRDVEPAVPAADAASRSRHPWPRRAGDAIRRRAARRAPPSPAPAGRAPRPAARAARRVCSAARKRAARRRAGPPRSDAGPRRARPARRRGPGGRNAVIQAHAGVARTGARVPHQPLMRGGPRGRRRGAGLALIEEAALRLPQRERIGVAAQRLGMSDEEHASRRQRAGQVADGLAQGGRLQVHEHIAAKDDVETIRRPEGRIGQAEVALLETHALADGGDGRPEAGAVVVGDLAGRLAGTASAPGSARRNQSSRSSGGVDGQDVPVHALHLHAGALHRDRQGVGLLARGAAGRQHAQRARRRAAQRGVGQRAAGHARQHVVAQGVELLGMAEEEGLADGELGGQRVQAVARGRELHLREEARRSRRAGHARERRGQPVVLSVVELQAQPCREQRAQARQQRRIGGHGAAHEAAPAIGDASGRVRRQRREPVLGQQAGVIQHGDELIVALGQRRDGPMGAVLEQRGQGGDGAFGQRVQAQHLGDGERDAAAAGSHDDVATDGRGVHAQPPGQVDHRHPVAADARQALDVHDSRRQRTQRLWAQRLLHGVQRQAAQPGLHPAHQNPKRRHSMACAFFWLPVCTSLCRRPPAPGVEGHWTGSTHAGHEACQGRREGAIRAIALPGWTSANRTTVRFIIPGIVSNTAITANKPAPASAAARRGTRSLQKGQQTRAAILDAALGLASHMGLEGLSIGALADVTKMSKSGVFAHFGSREELQIAVRDPPARGLPRLRALFERWVHRTSVEVDSGCIYISGAVEFDDRPGPVRDALVGMVRDWHAAIRKAILLAQEVGHLAPDADPDQVLFEMHGLILSLHHDARFLRSPGALARARTGLERILDSFATPAGRKADAQARQPQPAASVAAPAGRKRA
ncbi:bacterial regulatory protein, tetR family domain-containing protein [Ditylenchus destructor]|nr:bacterial regulatory protein, tetR family domain-containing protein [Ditylenchus destructor]